MPKHSDINSVLVLGAGPIVIGQACEFDYSGTQACRALREEGVRVALLNSNPATIMTDPDIADATYMAPVTAELAMAVIEREKVDAVLPTMGGQTALNCAIELEDRGVFGKNVRLIGARAESIRVAEDRQLFKQAMGEIGLQCAPSAVISDLPAALAVAKQIGFPIVARPSYTLGGAGGGVAYNAEELRELAGRGLAESPSHSVLLEKSLLGWKEFEMEVVRDRADNCIIVCSIENVDPMGVHTGDSITVAPAQTLTDKEYQRMRDAAIAVLRKIGVDTGGANVQFAVNPQNGELAVIEMNPRVSRSSALASKATGFPIAKVAAKLAVGFTLDEIVNDITGGTPASFEPSIDYIVVKAPRFDFAKFAPTPDALTTQMRSVGEVMAAGATFGEALQKALRGLETGAIGLLPPPQPPPANMELLRQQLREPHSQRLFDVAAAMRGIPINNKTESLPLEEIAQLTGIDPWFLGEMKEIVDEAAVIEQQLPSAADKRRLLRWKRMGFSDAQLAQLWAHNAPATDIYSAADVRRLREQWGVHPVYKRVDSCAGEFPTSTAYLYSTYHYDPAAPDCELRATDNRNKIMILGSGPNRIGQGVEFDYCCVHGVLALKEANTETLMVNCNPETVSTDYDIADRLFFEPLTAEDVWEICRREKPKGVIVQFGGQTPLSIAHELQIAGVPIIGTSVDAIDCAESRERFQQLLQKHGMRQPQNAIVNFNGKGDKGGEAAIPQKTEHALALAGKIGYPLVVRPSYVLGGKSMQIVHDDDGLRDYFQQPWLRDFGADLLLDKFLQDATEVDVDAVRDAEGQILVAGIMQHIEKAGVHSGDSACCLPPHSLPAAVVESLSDCARQLAAALDVVGLMNVQMAVCDGEVFILEVNPRASRTAPFVSKATGLQVAKIAARAMAGISLAQQHVTEQAPPPYFSVKEAVFPFNKFPDVDVLLGPEMKSTGETMGIAETYPRAFLLAQEAIMPMPQKGALFFSVPDADKAEGLQVVRQFHALGFEIVATRGSAEFCRANGVPVRTINKVKEGRPHIVDAIVSGEVDIVINTETMDLQSRRDSFSIRRAALVNRVVYYTTVAGAHAAAEGLGSASSSCILSLQEWHRQCGGQNS